MASRSEAGNGRPRSCINNQGRRRDAGQHLLRRMSVGCALSRRGQFDIHTDFQGQWSSIAKRRVGQELMSCLHFVNTVARKPNCGECVCFVSA